MSNTDILAIERYPNATDQNLDSYEITARLNQARLLAKKWPNSVALKKAVELWTRAYTIAKATLRPAANPNNVQPVVISGSPSLNLSYPQDRINFNAIWVKQTGAVEWVRIQGETADAYLVPAPISTDASAMVGVPKRLIVQVSLKARSLGDLVTELLRQGKSPIIKQIAAYAANPAINDNASTPYAEVLNKPDVFNALSQDIRVGLSVGPARQDMNRPAVLSEALAAAGQVKQSLAALQSDASGATTFQPDAGTVPDSLKPAWTALGVSMIRLFLMSDSPSIQQVTGILDAPPKVPLPPIDKDMLGVYGTFEKLKLIVADFHDVSRDILAPTIDAQQPLMNKGFQTLDELSDAHFQLVKASDDEFFLTSPAVSIESTFNTRTVCLTGLSKPIATFLASQDASQGKFALMACRTTEAETRGGVTFVRARPLIIADHPSAGVVNLIYADPKLQQHLESLTVGYLAEMLSSPGSNATLEADSTLPPKDRAITSLGAKQTGSSEGWAGSWRLVSGNATQTFSLDATGYSPDKTFRLRESSGLLLLRGPDDTWTFSKSTDNTLRGSSHSRGTSATLERN